MRVVAGGVGVALLAAVGCGTLADRDEPVPEGWVAFDTGCGFHFHAPPETVAMPAQGIDSCPGDDDTPKVTFAAACRTRDALGLPQRIFRTVELDPR